jgi:hypothetical protein
MRANMFDLKLSSTLLLPGILRVASGLLSLALTVAMPIAAQAQGIGSILTQGLIGSPTSINSSIYGTGTINQQTFNQGSNLQSGSVFSGSNAPLTGNQGGDVTTSASSVSNGQGGPSGNPLTPEQYNTNGPPTRPSGTTTSAGSVTTNDNATATGNQGTVPIQTICPY